MNPKIQGDLIHKGRKEKPSKITKKQYPLHEDKQPGTIQEAQVDSPISQQPNIPEESLIIVDSKHPISKEYIEFEVKPKLVSIAKMYPEVMLIYPESQIHQLCIEDLASMIQDAKTAGIDITVRSAFRSYDEQQLAYNDSTNKSAIARPGESQHHTGLAVDLSSPEIGNMVGKELGFEYTNAGNWLSENSYKYGFVQPYTNNHDGIINESWHYFYAGKDLALIWYKSRSTTPTVDFFGLQFLISTYPNGIPVFSN